MARRKSFTSTIIQINRDLERKKREKERKQAAAIRARILAQKAADRAAKADAKERSALYTEARLEETNALQAELDSRMEDLERILSATLTIDDYIELSDMKEIWKLPAYDPGVLGRPHHQPDPVAYYPSQPKGIGKLLPGSQSKYQQAINEARLRYEHDFSVWQQGESERRKKLNASQAEYERWIEQEKNRIDKQHREVDEFIAGLGSKQPDSVTEYFGMVLDGSVWPDQFPQSFLLAYDPSSGLLGIDYILPTISVVPEIRTYKYIKSRDEIAETPLSISKRKRLYSSIVSQTALRVIHEIFEADRSSSVETIALNCFVNTVDPATGRPVQPCLLSVKTTEDKFNKINLKQVEPIACLKGLSAAVSPKPSELAPVRPMVELKMIDSRFVNEQDVLSELDQRPNLMDLNPYEFENLVTNLFRSMGLECKQTQSSRDGGVDCVAYDTRPIFGGKVVIQAKRYKSTVGVSAVRDLYGTVQNEGASKGILVTTSGFGQASHDFAKGKPLELLSGPNLLYLLEEHAAMKACIIVPGEWKDPIIDLDKIDITVEPPSDPSLPGSNPQTKPFPQPNSKP